MGGPSSGGRGWRGGKSSVDCLPVAKLTHASTSATWQRSTYVRPEGNFRATVVHGHRQWTVAVSTHELHFGGFRRWLVCPVCVHKRVALYIAGDHVACRTCLDLRYACQHASHRSRMCWRADRIRERLGWGPGVLMAPGKKPPRMHWRTYIALVTELDQLTEALVGSVCAWLDRTEELMEQKHTSR